MGEHHHFVLDDIPDDIHLTNRHKGIARYATSTSANESKRDSAR